MVSIPVCGSLAVALLYHQAGLHRGYLGISLFWGLILDYWIYSISACKLLGRDGTFSN